MGMSLAGMEGPFGGGMENMGRFGSGMNMGRINGKCPASFLLPPAPAHSWLLGFLEAAHPFLMNNCPIHFSIELDVSELL